MIKKNRLRNVLLSVGMMAGSLVASNAMNMVVMQSDGTLKTYSLTETGRVYFEGDVMKISSEEGATAASLPLENVKKVSFSQSMAYDDVLGEAVKVFPNPTTDVVYLADASEKDVVEIVSATGCLLGVQYYSEQKGISLEKYTNGLYFVRVNGVSFKVYKR